MKRLSVMFFLLAVIVAGLTLAAIVVRASGGTLVASPSETAESSQVAPPAPENALSER
ncbi:MAG: hypothetical protein ACREOU_13855 [Candidatus Eiseniibacteriota bacterium]